jgi:signal transduction histidine kinase
MAKKFCIATIIAFIILMNVSVLAQSHDQVRIDSLVAISKAKVEKIQTALKQAEKTLAEAQKADDIKGQAEAFFMLGINWQKLLEYGKASEYYIKSQELYEKLGDNKKIARNLVNLGELYRAIGEFDLSINYCHKALRLYEKESDKPGIARSCDRLAAVFYEYTPAKPVYGDSLFLYINRALLISRDIKNDTLTSSCMNILGAAYMVVNNLDVALAHLKDALKFAVEKNIENDVALIRINIAYCYYSMENYKSALEYIKPAFEYAQRNNILPFIDMSTLGIYRAYAKLKDFEKAFKYLELYTNNRWELYDENRVRQIRALEVKYDTEKKEIELKNKEKIFFLEIIVFSILLLAAFFIIRLYIRRNKMMKKKNAELEKKNLLISEQNQKLSELNATKDKFFSIIGHDLKNPYQSLLGFSHILITDYKELTEQEIKEFAGYIFEASDMGNRLLQNLLDWSRSETGNIKYEPQVFPLSEIVNQAVNLAYNTALQKEISIKAEISGDIKVFCDKNMIYTVLRNLVSNSIKFSYRGGTVRVSSKLYNNTVEVSISDEGVGMNEILIEDLFKIEKRITNDGTENEKGTGLGLYLCKEFIEKNHGTIGVKSEVGKGSTFIFTLPAGMNDNE